jgi:hypothetical protein
MGVFANHLHKTLLNEAGTNAPGAKALAIKNLLELHGGKYLRAIGGQVLGGVGINAVRAVVRSTPSPAFTLSAGRQVALLAPTGSRNKKAHLEGALFSR